LGAGELEDLTEVVVGGEGAGRDGGDVLGVDEPLPRVPDGHAEVAAEDGVAKERLEVLREPVRPDDGPLEPTGPYRALGVLQAGDVHEVDGAVGVEHHALHPGGRRTVEEPVGQVDVVGEQQVEPLDVLEDGVPRRGLGPVERRVGAACRRAHRDAVVAQPGDDPTSDGAGPPEHENGAGGAVVRWGHGGPPVDLASVGATSDTAPGAGPHGPDAAADTGKSQSRAPRLAAAYRWSAVSRP